MIYRWTRQQITSYIRKTARDSKRIVFTDHANQRMKERKISTAMILDCLCHGQIKRQPESNLHHGTLECRMEYHTAGETIGVVVAISKDNPNLIVVTAMFTA